MSQAVVAEVLARALRDRAFAEALRSEPDAALHGYDLSDDERAAIQRGTLQASGSAPLEDRPHTAKRLI